MKATARRERLRAILSGSSCILPASVHDPLSARIAADLGFEAAMLAGSVASLAVLGAPDLILVTLSEFAEQARRIVRVCDIPLIVDADHGYGNALNVMRSVEELEAAGVAALTIEDTELPAGHGRAGTRLVTVEEGTAKVRAALAARDDPSLLVVGRTSAAAITGIDDAIARCLAYQEAGADAVFLSGLARRTDLEKLSARMRVPVLLGALSAELQDTTYLASQGVRIGLQGHLPLRAAVKAVHDTLLALREGRHPAEIDGLAPASLVEKLAREADYRRWTREYLNG